MCKSRKSVIYQHQWSGAERGCTFTRLTSGMTTPREEKLCARPACRPDAHMLALAGDSLIHPKQATPHTPQIAAEAHRIRQGVVHAHPTCYPVPQEQTLTSAGRQTTCACYTARHLLPRLISQTHPWVDGKPWAPARRTCCTVTQSATIWAPPPGTPVYLPRLMSPAHTRRYEATTPGDVGRSAPAAARSCSWQPPGRRRRAPSYPSASPASLRARLHRVSTGVSVACIGTHAMVGACRFCRDRATSFDMHALG